MGQKPVIVAEIGINHNGSVELAKKLIDVAVENKVDYVKFQKRTIEDVYTKEELDKPRESPWGTTNREQKLGLEFEKAEYDEIDRYCKEKGIKWFASPWDKKSVDFLMQYNPEYIKVASASITDEELLEHIAKSVEGTQTKIILATGMSNRKEIEQVLFILDSGLGYQHNVEYVLACTSSYPTPTKDLNLSRIEYMKYSASVINEYKIGFSNHYQGLSAMYAAMSLGAEMIEFHITLDRASYGSDQAASIEPNGVKRICEFAEFISKAMGNEELKITESEIPVAKKLRKS